MTRHLTVGVLVAAASVAAAVPGEAQLSRPAAPPHPVAQLTASWPTDLTGVVLDDGGHPVAGAVISALGSTTAFAVSDREGRFAFRNISPGSYLVRVHLQGYVQARGRVVQVAANSRNSITLSFLRRETKDEAPLLAAGVGPAVEPGEPAGRPEVTEHDHGETAWRLRHLKRSVLKEAEAGLVGFDDDSFIEESIAGLGRAVGAPARLATALLSDLSFDAVNGEINLLTRTAFRRPQELFSDDGFTPRGVAYVALATPGSGGEWSMRGAMTQGDLASWILEGAYVREADAAHRIEAGLSYGMQRYLGGNADALAAVKDGSRNVGSVFAYDTWSVSPHLAVDYGAKYARYDYLADRALISPRASVVLKPHARDSFAVRMTAARREVAPGAEEFLPPAVGIWLPPERTFSSLSASDGFSAERVDHLEIAAQREWPGHVTVGVRAFRQRVDDQLVTLFGVARPGQQSPLGHYYVASGGDVDARGWGIRVSRDVAGSVRGSIDYSRTDAEWTRVSPDAAGLARVAGSAYRRGGERFHDLTSTLESHVAMTATRVFVIYKLNSGFASPEGDGPVVGRFELQVNQALPFMRFTNAHWEMLIAVRNLFRESLGEASVYDELLVVRPPKRVVGGLTLKF